MYFLKCLRFLAIVALMATAGIAQADTISDNAADWLISQQVTSGATAGAFPWTAGSASVYANTQGATALGLVRVYERTGNATDLAAAIANGNCMLSGCVTNMKFTDGDHSFTGHDPLFLIELSRVTGDPQYADFVTTEMWDKLTAGEYGEANNQDVAANLVARFASRSSYPELVAWDLSKLAIAAHLAGQDNIATDVMVGVLQSLELSDASHTTYDIVGLAGAVWASAVTGIDLNPSSGKWAANNSTADLADTLLSYQASGGGFITDSSMALTDNNAETQTTAFAMQALDSLDSVLYSIEMIDGFASIIATQQGDGQILAAAGASAVGGGSVEVHAEATEAYASIVLRPQTVYVDDDYAGDAFGDSESFTHPLVNGGAAIAVKFGIDAFATITDALANVADGGDVYVAEGIYVEGSVATQQNLLVGQSVQLIGAQAGIDARNRSDSGASIIQPAVANPGLSYASLGDQVIVQIYSDNVTLDGFVLDGDNPVLTSNVDMGGTDPDVDAGVFATGSHIDISNNVVRNLVYAGIYNYNYPASVPAGVGNVIRHNWVHNIDAPSEWGIGIGVLWNYYADIDANLISNVRVGIQTNYFFKPTSDPASDALIHGNEVHASASAIYHNYQDGLGNVIASPWTINNNALFAVNNPAQDGLWVGLAFQGLHDGIADIHDNAIDGSALAGGSRDLAGYRVNLIDSDQSSNTTISGGTVSNVDYGVLATDGAFYEGELRDTNFAGIAFDNIAIAAFYVEDTALTGSETTDYAPKITIDMGNSYNNVAYQVALAGPNATIAFAAGVPLFDTVLVRAANDSHRSGAADSHGNIRLVENAMINQGIAIAASGGTVTVDAGNFDQNVIVNKSVLLQGPFTGTQGFDGSRDGTGEATITPASGLAVSVSADNVTFDGFTVKGVSTAGLFSGGYANGQVLNNRFVDSTTQGLYIESGVASAGWLVQNNLFDSLGGASSTAIRLVRADGVQVLDNVIRNVSYQGVQLSQITGAEIRRNEISGAQRDGINVAGSSNLVIADNTITNINQADLADRGAIRLYDSTTGVEAYCNIIDAQRGGIALRTGTAGGLHLFHNKVTGSSGARFVFSDWSAGIDIGSNWYDGTPVVTGPEAASVRLADGLPADPTNGGAFDVAGCGDNSPARVVAVSGTPQVSRVGDAFSAELEARVVDVLGGAVPGISIEFTVPAALASAGLSATISDSDYNGVIRVSATANTVAGSYVVTADTVGGTGSPATFQLSQGAADAGTLTYVSGDGQSGPAGIALTVPLSVIAKDAYGNPVEGVTVSFAVTDGGGNLASISAITDINGIASSGAWTLGPDAGVNNAEASAPDYPAVPAVGFSANGTEQADIVMQKTSTQSEVEAGKTVSYLLVITNVGPGNATEVNVLDALPSELNTTTASWVCVASGGAVCADGIGTGDVSISSNTIPVGGSLSVTVTAKVKSDTADGVFTNTAMAELTSGVDPNPGNDFSDRDIEVITIINGIFSDSFEDIP